MNGTTTRPHVAAVNQRLRAGETVTSGEIVAALAADTTRDDLDATANGLTERTGIQHYVYSTVRGDLVVYPDTYEQAYIDAGVPLERIASEERGAA